MRQGDALDLTPDIRARMVQDDRLQLPSRPHDLLPDRLENLSDRSNVLVAASAKGASRFNDVKPTWEIDLTRLVIDHHAGNRVVHLIREEALQGQGHCNVVGEPIRPTADLPKVVLALGMDDLDRRVWDDQLNRGGRPLGIWSGNDRCGEVLNLA